MRTTLIALVIGLAMAVSALAAETPFSGHFGSFDADKNGVVTPDEFTRHFAGSTRQDFDIVDSNKDGVVDHEEWHDYKAAHGVGHDAHDAKN